MTLDLPARPTFDAAFQDRLSALFAWRRDVRRFRDDTLAEGTLERLVGYAEMAPSVGNAQPWRFVVVESPAARAAIRSNFEQCNLEALASYFGERAALYARLKLEGLDHAPLQLAAFCDEDCAQGQGLGRATMPETLAYSVVGAIHTLWLAARAEGIGLGWLSILDPEAVKRDLEVPSHWRFIAYLCIGFPIEEHLDPELERHGWQARSAFEDRLIRR